MNEIKTDRRTQRTRKLFEDALIKLLKTKDINKITISDLSKEVDLNRGTFYIHYNDIYHLLESIEENLIYELERLSENLPHQNGRHLFDEELSIIIKALEFIDEQRETFKVLLNEQGNLHFLSKIKNTFSQKLLSNFLNTATTADKKYNSIMSSFLISGFIGIVQEWIKDDSDMSTFELATVILKMLKSSTSNLYSF
ncbi:MAG: TetR family transcriptional regulator C-terminal domain-containing protein [Firmicutes bacterium]|nr:TetR family transcriptional regulator C-terminal domain-containing protein [Bacillota bacterium]